MAGRESRSTHSLRRDGSRQKAGGFIERRKNGGGASHPYYVEEVSPEERDHLRGTPQVSTGCPTLPGGYRQLQKPRVARQHPRAREGRSPACREWRRPV